MAINVSLPVNYNHDIQMSAFALCWLKDFLEQQQDITKRPVRILEFGSGESTIWLDKTFPTAEIFSMEGNKQWYEKIEPQLTHVHYMFQQQDENYRLADQEINIKYLPELDFFSTPFDLIINDGAIREIVGDYVLQNADMFLSNGGIYLRHDYEKSINKDWLGVGLDAKQKEELGYEKWVAEHSEYSMLTVSGSGRWGFKAEFGGVYRRFTYDKN